MTTTSMRHVMARHVSTWRDNVKTNFAMLKVDPLFKLRRRNEYLIMSISFLGAFWSDPLLVKALSFCPFMAIYIVVLCIFDFSPKER